MHQFISVNFCSLYIHWNIKQNWSLASIKSNLICFFQIISYFICFFYIHRIFCNIFDHIYNIGFLKSSLSHTISFFGFKCVYLSCDKNYRYRIKISITNSGNHISGSRTTCCICSPHFS